MSKHLREGVSSHYFEAANRLGSKRARRRVVAYVESYDDVFFWRMVLDKFESDKLYFQIMLPTRSQHLERGKKAVLMEFLEGKTGRDMIACVDADYDYLLQGATPTSRSVLSNPYVFHTYAYAIENLQCFAPSLHAVCVAVTLNDHRLYDLEEFLRQYSQAIFPLFVWNIWYYRTPNYGRFTMMEFLRIIETGRFKIHQADEILQRLRHKVGQKVNSLQRENPDARQSYQQVQDDLRRLGVTADNVYLYIQGHHLFDKVVVPMLEDVCRRLVREREMEIERQSVHSTQRRNELSCYSNSVEDVSAMLKKNAGGMASSQFQQIQRDVAAFVEAISTTAVS